MFRGTGLELLQQLPTSAYRPPLDAANVVKQRRVIRLLRVAGQRITDHFISSPLSTNLKYFSEKAWAPFNSPGLFPTTLSDNTRSGERATSIEGRPETRGPWGLPGSWVGGWPVGGWLDREPETHRVGRPVIYEGGLFFRMRIVDLNCVKRTLISELGGNVRQGLNVEKLEIYAEFGHEPHERKC